ncbi:hypothetical protein FRC08_014673 [Ceratobasidium sp. 394]|nr:hypothetical protein FRC08_014673 [Ceratobasidium sp. 394]KAG9094814.1 hypothetical protein FS749_011754 [Ceratobasidium sp. UAMH 11750]
MDGNAELLYALDTRPIEYTFGSFKPSPPLFGTIKSKDFEVDSVLDQPTSAVTSLPRYPRFQSLRLDDAEREAIEPTLLTDHVDRFERRATGNIPSLLGPTTHDPCSAQHYQCGKSTLSGSSRTKGHSRAPPSVLAIRPSTTRVVQAISPASTANG